MVNLQKSAEYSRYYGDFKGVDFSNDHSQVSDNRFAYLVNMYKDYQSGQGKAIETIPGFRQVFQPNFGEGRVNGMHSIVHNGELIILVHVGTDLYRWHAAPKSTLNTSIYAVVEAFGNYVEGALNEFVAQLSFNVSSVMVRVQRGTIINPDLVTIVNGNEIHIQSSSMKPGDIIQISFVEGYAESLFAYMNDRKSTSFVFNNNLYILDGEKYMRIEIQENDSRVVCTPTVIDYYKPTVRIGIIPGGENANVGKEYEQKNMLSPVFYLKYVSDGKTTVYHLPVETTGVMSVTAYGISLGEGTAWSYDAITNSIIFRAPVVAPQEMGYPEGYDGVVVEAYNHVTTVPGLDLENYSTDMMIERCTIATVFDNRVFFSGNPACPNHVFWCAVNSLGYPDPSYFGVLNFQQDGVENSPITGMIPVADTLMVLKGDTQQDGSVYFHKRQETGEDVVPVVYPSQRGLHGIGCLGACINFLDDPVFVSRLGLEAVGQLSVRYERALEHRSSLVDAMLVNEDLSSAMLEEWNGYLLLLVNGKVFMADSRQRYTHESGIMQYEWYYLDDIGVYVGQYDKYTYSRYMPEELSEITVDDGGEALTLCIAPQDMQGEIANFDGAATVKVKYVNLTLINGVYYTDIPVYYQIMDGKAYLCEKDGCKIGGTFDKAICIKNINGNIYFGTELGNVCIFNFDKREEDGSIGSQWYSFNGRAIFSGCATKMDSCGIPHLTKTTIKKSTVIKTKAFNNSAFKVKVRTNRSPYNEIASVGNSLFDASAVNFAAFSFSTNEQSLFAIKESEKKWVEKQIFLFSDAFEKPFGVYYVAYRYRTAGRYKGG